MPQPPLAQPRPPPLPPVAQPPDADAIIHAFEPTPVAQLPLALLLAHPLPPPLPPQPIGPPAPASCPSFVATALPSAFFTELIVPAGLPIPVAASVLCIPVAAVTSPSVWADAGVDTSHTPAATTITIPSLRIRSSTFERR